MLLKIENLINRLLDIIGVIAGVFLLLLVLIISYNVIDRYVFSSSSVALEELAWHFYSSVFLLGMSYALRTESHVRVDVFFENLSGRTQAIIDIIGTLVFLLPMNFIVIYYGWDFMAQAYSLGEHSDSFPGLVSQLFTTGIGEGTSNPGGLPNRFIIKGLIPLSFVLLALSSIGFLVKKINVLLNIDTEDACKASVR
ncbi:TRAP transporter small permease subunit [Vibrio sp. RC27]